ncbi:MAG TPA: glycosyltransferase [Bradyrhizobium sp.]|uniref:glycosyltransferase n=1 Tax=Bradyrhizobium sp. TaxID=376 RepID=UPI002B5558E0|nr:glycosyltransferase [Bradyrhizobium sp.]HLZ01624.1 glycosyltransferase [Bradyrhizobium sp.]
MAIYVDHTHLGRHITGLERITLELFSAAALAPLDVVPVTARGVTQMVMRQTFGLPFRLAASSSILLCPGFPPSPLLRPFASRVLPYIHDIFLLSRPADLNPRARLYMSAPFKLALRHYPRFLANSSDTMRKLAAHCRPDATITLYRPTVRNVFHLDVTGRTERAEKPLRLVALGTVEPRKNFVAAAQIVGALRALGYADATLEIVGRRGWGDEWRMLERLPGVKLHGYQPADRVRQLLHDADLLICTSHDEGLGLPLLEAQYAGLPIAAPDAAIFREVLDGSGIFIDPGEPDAAAARIAAMLSEPDWRARYVELAARNLARWNALATSDRNVVIALIAKLAGRQAPPRMAAPTIQPGANEARLDGTT